MKMVDSWYFPSSVYIALHSASLWETNVAQMKYLFNYLSYVSPCVRKLYPHGDIISKLYKHAFYSGHLSHNTSYGNAATI